MFKRRRLKGSSSLGEVGGSGKEGVRMEGKGNGGRTMRDGMERKEG